jgi:hypothetical protein
MNSLFGEREMNNMVQSPCLVRNIPTSDGKFDPGDLVKGMSKSVK